MCLKYAKLTFNNVLQVQYLLLIKQDDVEPYFEAYHYLGDLMDKSDFKASNSGYSKDSVIDMLCFSLEDYPPIAAWRSSDLQ